MTGTAEAKMARRKPLDESAIRTASVTCTRPHDDSEWEFVQACETFKKSYGITYLAATDYLRVAYGLGYRKVPGVGRPLAPEPAPA